MSAKGAEMSEQKHTVPVYEVARDGRVFSCTGWRGNARRELHSVMRDDGYLTVRLTLGGKRKRLSIHRLVALCWIGKQPSPHHEVRHLNGDCTDNRADNLAWGTRKQNADDRALHGRTSHGERHSAAIKRGIQNSANPYWRHAR